MVRTFLTSVPRRSCAVAVVLAMMGFVVADDDAKKAEPAAPKFALKKELPPLPAVFSKKEPENIDDLKDIQEQVNKTYERVKHSVVCLSFGGIVGSGVVVTKDGYVLTAGHVSAAPNRAVKFVFYEGKTVKGTTLGGNHGIDSGFSKIDTPGDYVPVEIGDSSKVRIGQWVFVCSHPGGYRPGRTPPVRLGRVLGVSGSTISTDCVMVGGDSGGPLFDMHGRVIGINSRIGGSLAQNMHVPTNPFVENWDKLAKAEVWGGNKFGGGGKLPPKTPVPAKTGVYLGVKCGEDCVVQEIVADSPAEKAGLKANDAILKCDGKEIANSEVFLSILRAKKVGDEIRLEVRRGDEIMTMTATLAKRPA